MQVTGGVVALIEINAGAGFVTQIGAAFMLFPNQAIRITYTVAPTVNVIQL